MAAVRRLYITRDATNEYIFTIKKSGSTAAITIHSSDTFRAKLLNISSLDVIALEKDLTVVSAEEGAVKLTITPSEASTLMYELGAKEDYYYPKAVYRLIMTYNTVDNGPMVVNVGKVYVK
jgi:hypothetical protein